VTDSSSAITDAVFRAVRTGNAFEETVERLLEGIKLGVYAPGDRLPAERELTGRLGVSRITLREALRELGAAGYVQTKRGRFGGTFVIRQPEAPSLAAAVRDMGRFLDDALTFRRVVETGAAEMAARATLSQRQREELAECLAVFSRGVQTSPPDAVSFRGVYTNPPDPPPATVPAVVSSGREAPPGSPRPDDPRSSLRSPRNQSSLPLAAEQALDPAEYRSADTRLHLAIADAAGSPSLTASVVEARVRLVDLLNAIPMLERNLNHANVQHARIVHAILAGDADRARQAMEEHVAGTAALLRGFLKQ
jgi:GntR family transcriptional repressor for pyruvate dehydrogenase complex